MDEFDLATMPAFANLENQKLDKEVKDKERLLTAIEAEIEENTERITLMNDHLRNVQQELLHTQGIWNAKTKEIETEDHLKQLAEREEGRLKNEMRRISTEIVELQDKINVIQNSIFKGNQRLDAMKAQMNMDQQELEQWAQKARQKEEDAMTLMRYARADESKIKELSLQIERLTQEVSRAKKDLDAEVTETQSAHVELEKSGIAFRQIHQERQDLIRQWESAIEQMQKRDAEIQMCSAEFARLKQDIRKREEEIKEKQRFLAQEVENNQEAERKIATAERQAGKLRQDHMDAESALIQFQDEVEALRSTLGKTSTDLTSRRAEVTQLRNEITEKKRRLDHTQKQLLVAKQNLQEAVSSAMSMEEKAKKLEELHRQEEARVHEIERELRHLKESHFKKSQEVFALKQDETNLLHEIQGTQAASKNLTSKIYKLDAETLKQQELIYSQEFQLQQLERKIARLQGERTDEEERAMKARIEELTKELESQTSTHTLLSTQLKRLQDDIRHAKRELERASAEKETLSAKIGELTLHNDSASRELKKLVSSKQSMMVDENVIKLELRRLRQLLNVKADEVMTLEKRRLHLRQAMEERMGEINAHKDLLRAQLRDAEEQRHAASIELRDRLQRVDKLKKKYEIVVTSMAPEDGTEEKSQAYFLIRAAQQKEELQQQGDDLDAKIRKAEKEIRALENTLRLMNDRNDQFRRTFQKADLYGKESEQLAVLEEQYRGAMDKFKSKRREIKELQEELQTLEQTLANLSQDETNHMTRLDDLETRLAMLAKDLEDQKGKKERASKVVSKLCADLRQARGTGDQETPEERDFRLKELRQFNQQIVERISKVADEHPEIGHTVDMLFEQAGIPKATIGSSSSQSSLAHAGKPASRGSSVASTRPSSAASSVSGVSQPLSAASSRARAYAPGAQQTRAVAPKVMGFNPSTGQPSRPHSGAASKPPTKPSNPSSRSGSRPTSGSGAKR